MTNTNELAKIIREYYNEQVRIGKAKKFDECKSPCVPVANITPYLKSLGIDWRTEFKFNKLPDLLKSLEGIVDSGVLEEPVLTDVKTMIALSYEKGEVNDSIAYMNTKYPFYMVKNMHQLFLQVTKEGAKDTEETFDNMLNDIDVLVEGVYRDRMDRANFH